MQLPTKLLDEEIEECLHKRGLPHDAMIECSMGSGWWFDDSHTNENTPVWCFISWPFHARSALVFCAGFSELFALALRRLYAGLALRALSFPGLFV
jgi:hypothetical protein